MKKYFSGISSVMVTVIIFAFTIYPRNNFSDYVWYGIKPTVHKPCNYNLAEVTLSDLYIDHKYASTTAGFQMDIQTVTFGAGEGSIIFLCDLVNEELCAVGYLKPSIGSSGFTVWNGKWVPTIAPVVQTCMSERQ